jgi:hypothetical protein
MRRDARLGQACTILAAAATTDRAAGTPADPRERLYVHLCAGPPRNWPASAEWEEGFDLTEADDAYAEVHPYADPRH